MKLDLETKLQIYIRALEIHIKHREEREEDGEVRTSGMCSALLKSGQENTMLRWLGEYQDVEERLPDWYACKPKRPWSTAYWFEPTLSNNKRVKLFEKLIKQTRKEWKTERRVKLVRVLKDIYDYYIEHPTYENGMCLAVCELYGNPWTEKHTQFHGFLQETIKNRRRFYNWEGELIYDSSQYLWKRDDREKRIQWLDKQIKKLA